MVNDVTTTGILEREAKSATGQRISMGPHHVVVRPDSHGLIALIEVELLGVDLLFVNVFLRRTHIHKSLHQTFIHYQMLEINQ